MSSIKRWNSSGQTHSYRVDELVLHQDKQHATLILPYEETEEKILEHTHIHTSSSSIAGSSNSDFDDSHLL